MSVPVIFISYRRTDSGELAVRIGDDLKKALGLGNVFLDIEDLFPGDVFPDELRTKIQRSDVILILIGTGWGGAAGIDRLANSDDWVRYEVSMALDAPGHVIPVMIGEAELPESLPDDIAPLKFIHQLRFDPNDYGVAYQSVLVGVWRRVAEPPLIVSDNSDEAEVAVEGFLRTLIDADLVEAQDMSSSVARGLRAIPLRSAAERWPEVIVLTTKNSAESPAFQARMHGLVGVKEVALVGVGAGLGVLGHHAAASASEPAVEPDGSAAQADAAPVGGHADTGQVLGEISEHGTVATYSSPSDLVTSMRRGWWQSLSTGVKATIITPVAAIGVWAGIALTAPDPIVLVGEWDVGPAEVVDYANWGRIEDVEQVEVGSQVYGSETVEFLPTEDCADPRVEPCDVEVRAELSLLRNVARLNYIGGNHYDGEFAFTTTCGDTVIPDENRDISLNAVQLDADTLEFTVREDVSGVLQYGCNTDEAHFVVKATATRS